MKLVPPFPSPFACSIAIPKRTPLQFGSEFLFCNLTFLDSFILQNEPEIVQSYYLKRIDFDVYLPTVYQTGRITRTK